MCVCHRAQRLPPLSRTGGRERRANRVDDSSRKRALRVLAPVLGVDVLQVVRAGPDVLDRALRGEVLRVVVLLTELGGG